MAVVPSPFGSQDQQRGDGSDKQRRWKGNWAVKGLAALIVVFVLTAGYQVADRKRLTALVDWVDAHHVKGAAALVAVQITCTICLIPTGFLAVAAGALFGFTRGMVLIWAACVVGETMAFALGRHLFRAYIERVSAAWPTWVAMEAALREDGWKLVLLLRCCPASPFTLLNYALGSTSLPFSHFFWPSVFGIAPGIAVYVWGGHLLKDLSEVANAEGAIANATPPQARVAFAVISGITAVAVLVGSAVYTKRALAKRLARVESGAADDAEMGRKGSGDARKALVCHADLRAGIAQRGSVGGRVRNGQALQPPVPAPATPPQQSPHQQQQLDRKSVV